MISSKTWCVFLFLPSIPFFQYRSYRWLPIHSAYMLPLSGPRKRVNFSWLFFLFSPLFMATPAAYENSQPRGGIRASPGTYTAAAATPNPSHICNLHHSLWPCRILKPLSEARDPRIEPTSSQRQCPVPSPLSHNGNSPLTFLNEQYGFPSPSGSLLPTHPLCFSLAYICLILKYLNWSSSRGSVVNKSD